MGREEEGRFSPSLWAEQMTGDEAAFFSFSRFVPLLRKTDEKFS